VPRSPYIQSLLKKTEEKRAERYEENLNHYNEKNFCDAFGVLGGKRAGLNNGDNLSEETAAKVREWSKKHC